MALPPSYNTSRDYLSDCLHFLKSFSWLYNYHNTFIIVNRILTYFPYEWVLYFKDLSCNNLNRLLEGEIKVSKIIISELNKKRIFYPSIFQEDCPGSLKNLISQLTKLKPNIKSYSQKCSPKLVHNSGLSRKKLHEIVSLAPLIDNICSKSDTNTIIDIGAGLVSSIVWYISTISHEDLNFKFLKEVNIIYHVLK